MLYCNAQNHLLRVCIMRNALQYIWSQFGGWNSVKNSRTYPNIRRITYAELNGVQSSLDYSPTFGTPSPGGWTTITYNLLPPICYALNADDLRFPADATSWNNRVASSQTANLGSPVVNSVVFCRSNDSNPEFGMNVSIDVLTTQLIGIELSLLDNLTKVNYPRGIESASWNGLYSGVLRLSIVFQGFGHYFMAVKLTTAPGGGSPPTPPASAIIMLPAILIP